MERCGDCEGVYIEVDKVNNCSRPTLKSIYLGLYKNPFFRSSSYSRLSSLVTFGENKNLKSVTKLF